MSRIINANVEIERWEGGRLTYDTYNGVAGYSILNGVLTIVDLDGEDVWSYLPDAYETITHWEVVEDD